MCRDVISLQKCAQKEQVDSRALDQRKTLQTSNAIKTTEDDDEFAKQRTAAIAEVAKSKEVSDIWEKQDQICVKMIWTVSPPTWRIW